MNKYILNLFSFYDHTGITDYLEKQAAKGYRLKKIGNFIWKFTKEKPLNLHYSVVYFPSASEFDSAPSEEQKTMKEFCERAGWIQIGQLAQMMIFYNEAAEPVPIETDPLLQTETVHKAMKKNYLISQSILMLLGLIQAITWFISFFDNPISILSDNARLLSGLCWIILILLTSVEIGGYFRWYKKAVKAAQDEEIFIPTRGHRRFQSICLLLVSFGFIYIILSSASSLRMRFFWGLGILYVVLVFGGVNGMKFFMRKKGGSTGLNRIITFITSFVLSFSLMGVLVFIVINLDLPEETALSTYTYNGKEWYYYNDEVPLHINDLLDNEHDEYSTRIQKKDSILLSIEDVRIIPRKDSAVNASLYYTVTDVKLPILYDFIKDKIFYAKDDSQNNNLPQKDRYIYIPINFEAIEAKAYHLHLNEIPTYQYLICTDNKLIEFHFGFDADTAVITKAVNILQNSSYSNK